MKRLLKAAALYFLAVFATAFALGTVRVAWVVPVIGARAAELAELPLMLLASFFAARWIVRREPQAPPLAVGLLALAGALVVDVGVVLPLRGLSLERYFAELDPVSAAAYYASLAVFAVLPVFVAPRVGSRRVRLACALAVLVAPVAVIYAKYRHDVDIELARVSAGSEIAQTPCGPIEYASIGQGPAVLLVHGAGGGYDQTVEVGRELAVNGLRAVMPSRFGYLRTPLPADASPQAQADAHACLLDALEIERAAVVGISAGGPSSMQFALRHPRRTSALVLLVALAYAPREPAAPLSPAALFMIERGVRSDFLFWAAMTTSPNLVIGTILGTPPELVAKAEAADRVRVNKLMRQILPVSRRQQGLLNEAKVASSLPRYDLERIAAPTLVVSVEDDRYGTYAGARYTAAHVPNARFVGFPTGGHLWIGHHAQVMAELEDFLGIRHSVSLWR